MRARALRQVLAVILAFGGALVPLLLLDGDRRALGFRAYGLLIGLLALRAILGFSVDAGAPPVGSPFEAPRRSPLPLPVRWSGRRRDVSRRTASDHLAASAISQASAFHFRLRPVLRDVADQRLRAKHGIGVDDAGAAALLGPLAYEHLRSDRPPPDDRRARGIDPAALDTILTTLERL